MLSLKNAWCLKNVSLLFERGRVVMQHAINLISVSPRIRFVFINENANPSSYQFVIAQHSLNSNNNIYLIIMMSLDVYQSQYKETITLMAALNSLPTICQLLNQIFHIIPMISLNTGCRDAYPQFILLHLILFNCRYHLELTRLPKYCL